MANLWPRDPVCYLFGLVTGVLLALDFWYWVLR